MIPTERKTARRLRRLPILLLLAAGLAAGAACSGSGSGSGGGVASIKTASDTKSKDGDDKAAKDKKAPEDAALDFARCMREHGIDMPDPNFSGQGTVTMAIGKGFDPNDAKFQEAQQACGSAFGPKGTKGGPEFSVGGGKVDNLGDGKGGAGFSVSGGAVASSGGGGK